jgi:O-methyltransferase
MGYTIDQMKGVGRAAKTRRIMRTEAPAVTTTRVVRKAEAIQCYDVTFWDTVGGATDGSGPEKHTGGSEWATIKIARELARRGLRVQSLTNGGPAGRWDGVDYANARTTPRVNTNVLVNQRFSAMPARADFKHLFVAVHDTVTTRSPNLQMKGLLEAGLADILCVGEWQRNLFPKTWRTRVVGGCAPPPPAIRAKIKGRYVFPPAYAGRGLAETLEYWERLRPPGGELVVMIPPYGGKVPSTLPPGVLVRDSERRMEELAIAEGVFYVNTSPECLPNIYIAEAMGCRIHVLGLHQGGLCGIRDAVRSTLPTTDPKKFTDDFVRWSRESWELKESLRTACEAPYAAPHDFSPKAAGDRWMGAFADHGVRDLPDPMKVDTASPAVVGALTKAFAVAPPGDYYEFGVYRGGSMVAATRAAKASPRRFFGFDSFRGLPKPEGIDKEEKALVEGSFACSKEEVENYLRGHDVDMARVTMVDGTYDQLTEEHKADLSMGPAGVVLIDCDLYASAVQALSFVRSLLKDGTVVLFDDWNLYGARDDRGERRAFAEFLASGEWSPTVLCDFGWHGRAFIMKRKR